LAKRKYLRLPLQTIRSRLYHYILYLYIGLKKVTNDMKTHKNPELRKHHVPVPYKPKTAAFKPMGKAATKAPAQPPKLALEGKKWVVVSIIKSSF